MTFLDRSLRNQLEKACIAARDTAEQAVDDAFARLALTSATTPFSDPARREHRNRLRTRARQIGNGRAEDSIGYGAETSIDKGIPHLREQFAYEHWHRLLFARFLAENGQLIPAKYGVPLSMQDCDELAPSEHARDGWELATRYASERLPGLFSDAISVELAPEARQTLISYVEHLPEDVFTAADALGWVYQFWQKKKKDEVNASERKIGGADLSPVTQLFTEDYMVRFLLENTLGAWWVKRHPESPLLREWEYLRFRDDGTPAAGTFDGWPNDLREITVIDPCCGSGHFLVAAFGMLHQMRMEELGEDTATAADAVLRENLFGLELDARCTQIATVAVALAAWQVGGHPEITIPHIACSGTPVAGQLKDWQKAANGDATLRSALEYLHTLFQDAPTLGSLIDPTAAIGTGDLWKLNWERVEASLQELLQREGAADPASALFGGDAIGAARALSYMSRKYTLVATNVPYLGKGKQGTKLTAYLHENFPEGEDDLATAFAQRVLRMLQSGGTVALVTPSNWTTLTSYRDFRRLLLDEVRIEFLALLGEEAWQSFGIRGPRAGLTIASIGLPFNSEHQIVGIDAATPVGSPPILIEQKMEMLRTADLAIVKQFDQHSNPDSRIILELLEQSPLLETYADGLQGIASADYPRYGRTFWEIEADQDIWPYQQSTMEVSAPYSGKQHVIRWQRGDPAPFGPGSVLRGRTALGRRGVAAAQMRNLPCTLFNGTYFDNNTAVILPKIGHEDKLPAIWAFCSSPEFNQAVRRIDTKKNVTNATLVKVPFDLERWQKVAEAQYSNGLPEPHSDDPTQWLFKGNIVGSQAPLQVAVARLLGYRWPEQSANNHDPDDDNDEIESLVDSDGIVCLPALDRQQPAADRVYDILSTAHGDAWSPQVLDGLLRNVGFAGKDLATWLTDKKGFFAQHVKLFHNRPFIWHISDGLRGGFSALVNYHKLNRATLGSLIYVYLDEWIRNQELALRTDVAGAEARVTAAKALREKLVAIETGEQPYDLYVRWKSLAEQPLGWEPDLNDGVRLNIRPFIEAGVLHAKFSINWNKDRGKDPAKPVPSLESVSRDRRAEFDKHYSVERFNDLHFTLEEKRRARETAARQAQQQPDPDVDDSRSRTQAALKNES